MFVVNKDRPERHCKSCNSENTRLYGEETRDPSSIKNPTEAELRQQAARDQAEYELRRDEYRKRDEISVRQDVEDAKHTVKQMETEGEEAEFIDIWRNTAELREDEIQKLIEERSSRSYWQRFGYRSADDWVQRHLELKPNWYDGRHICPCCHTYGLTFQSGILFD